MNTMTESALMRPAVFRRSGSLLYADNCRDLQAAVARGEAKLAAWTRGGYPGTPLGGRLPGICTVGYWDAPTGQTWGLKRHCNEGVKIGYVARGSLPLEVDGVRFELTRGQLFIARPWQLHAIGCPNVGANQLIWVLIDVDVRRPDEAWIWPDWFLLSPSDAKRLTDCLALNERSVLSASRELASAFEMIRTIVQRSTPADGETKLKLAVNAMAVALLDRMNEDPPPIDPAFASTRKTVEVFLARLSYAVDCDWTLDDMATECGLSRTRFAYYCRLITNQTPTRYLKHLRLLHAARLIRTERRRSLTDIALASGFNSSQYFSNAFKRHFGMAPRDVTLSTEGAGGALTPLQRGHISGRAKA
jgi:AraC family transcriptional regulator, L-rhamnose operon regulatory protein RhaS